MSYRKLAGFQPILNHEGFNYVSDPRRIKEVEEIISYHLPNPDGNESVYVRLLEEFLNNLTGFYNSVGGDKIPSFRKGYSVILNELRKCISLFYEPAFKRRAISRGYYRKTRKRFLHGLSLLLNGIRIMFDPDILSSVKVSRGQIVNYILDSTEGLGRKLEFNARGRHSFAGKIHALTRQELQTTLKLLGEFLSGGGVKAGFKARSINGWLDLGRKRDPVRILVYRKRSLGGVFGRIRKDWVSFLFRISEHAEYEAQLRIPPEKTLLSPS